MKNSLRFKLLIVVLAIGTLSFGQVDLSMVYKIRQEGQVNSDMETLSYALTDLAGPRLTGSEGFDRAAEIAKAKMIEYGFSNVKIEKTRTFDKGSWDYTRAYAAMTQPYYCNFAVTPVAWTSGTEGLINCDVISVDIKTSDDIEKYRGKLKGKAVILSLPSFRPSTGYQVSYEPLAKRYTDQELSEMSKAEMPGNGMRFGFYGDWRAIMELRGKVNEFIAGEGVSVIIDNGNAFNVPRSTGSRFDGKGALPVTEINLPMEAYDRMKRLIQHGEKVVIEAEVAVDYTPQSDVYNVIGEIPGTDSKLKDEVVLLGAHLDSWQGGTGAADNASGCMVMLESLRILKALDIAPRRTIRVALWGGEEEGLYGSESYVSQYLYDEKSKERKPGFNKFSVYFNMDNGTGRYRGIYLQENDLVRPIFEEWAKPFNDMDFKTITIRNTGGTDHESFDAVGLPAFQFIQDEIEYDRGYHSSMDTYERLLLPDLRQNAIITAWFAYNAAMSNDLIPRKPEIKVKKDGRPPMF